MEKRVESSASNTFLAYFTQSTDEVNWKTRIALMFRQQLQCIHTDTHLQTLKGCHLFECPLAQFKARNFKAQKLRFVDHRCCGQVLHAKGATK